MRQNPFYVFSLYRSQTSVSFLGFADVSVHISLINRWCSAHVMNPATIQMHANTKNNHNISHVRRVILDCLGC
jgi:hypothetical protein